MLMGRMAANKPDPNEPILLDLYILSGKEDQAIAALRAAGITVEPAEPGARVRRVRSPIERLFSNDLADAGVFLDWPDFPIPQGVGSRQTEGAAVIGADVAEAHGLSGQGTAVGVLGTGIGGIEQSRSTGDLPETVVAQSFRGDGKLDVDPEGTAILEIIHDVAPGADLFFANVETSLDVGAAVNWLAERCDIICSDLIFLRSGPYDGTSPPSEALTSAAESGKIVLQAVGNFAQDHFAGRFTDQNQDEFHDFANEGIRFQLFPGQQVLVVLQWDDPWENSANDYDLYLFDFDKQTFDSSENTQTPGVPPLESIDHTNTTQDVQNLGILVRNFESRAQTRDIEIFVAELITARTGLFSAGYAVPGSSVPNMADARLILTAGAVPFQASGTIETFSSNGPTNDGRLQPTGVSPDRVTTSVIGFGTFVGTSAAAAHAAGAASLLLEYAKEITSSTDGAAAKVIDALKTGSADLGQAGEDNVFGYGRLDLRRSGARLARQPDAFSANVNRYGTVNTLDLLDVRSGWHVRKDSSRDVDWSGMGDLADILLLMNQWGRSE
jgi:hypothetical protein